MIKIRDLHKSFGDIHAVDGIDLEVRDGEIFGLLGPNGAGKTTTISMISGILRPDTGRIEIDGMEIWDNPKKVKSILGVVPQEIALYEDLTPKDNLMFWGRLHGLRGDDLKTAMARSLEKVGLQTRGKDTVKTFSGGMKRRLNLAMGLLHSPKILLLDEPTVGIDPQARLTILEIIREIAGRGTTVLYTTHYMEEAEEICNRLAIMDHGKVLCTGTVEELRRRAGKAEVLRMEGDFDRADLYGAVEVVEGVKILHAAEGKALLSVDSEGPGLMAVMPAILDSGLKISDLSIQQPNLQSVFIALTGRELRD